MSHGMVAEFDELREVAFGAIGAAYAALGSSLSENSRIISVFNSTDQDVYITDDPTFVKNKIRLASGTGQILDLNANKIDTDGMMIRKGRQFYIKHAGVAPTVGNAWLQNVYGGGGY